MELSTDRLILRPFRGDDYRGYFNLVAKNRQRLEKYFPLTVKSTQNIEATKRYIQERMYLSDKLEFISFIILLKGQPDIAGLVFLKNIDWNIPKSEIGFFIDKDLEGRGIITEAVKVVVKHSFEKLHINKLYMRAGEDNPGSSRIAEKCGFRLEGKLRNDFKAHNGQLLDVLYYGLIPADLATKL